MKHIGAVEVSKEKNKKTERGELLNYFSGKIQKPIGYVAYRLTGFQVKDLYYIKSICDDAERRGTPWGKVFFGSLKNNK